MNETITDLNNHLLLLLDTISNKDITEDQLKFEQRRGQIMTSVAHAITESIKVEVMQKSLTLRVLKMVNDGEFSSKGEDKVNKLLL